MTFSEYAYLLNRSATICVSSSPYEQRKGPWCVLSDCPRLCASSGLATSDLPDLDDIAVGITHVAANLHAMVLWLGQEFGSSASPLLVAGPDVCDTYVQEARNLMRILRG